MCHHDGFGTDVPAQLLEVAVAQFAGGKLDAHLMQGCIFPGVEMHTMERHAEPLAERDNKSLVAVGLVATQMKVAVDRLHRTSLLNHLEQQANTVCPPAQSHKIFLHSSFKTFFTLHSSLFILHSSFKNITPHTAPAP